MIKDQHLNGGNHKSDEANNGNKIEFPVTYVLKLVMAHDENNVRQKNQISALLNKENVVHNFKEERPSTKGKYVSYSIMVTLIDELQLKRMYEALKLIPGLKLAI